MLGLQSLDLIGRRTSGKKKWLQMLDIRRQQAKGGKRKGPLLSLPPLQFEQRRAL